MEGKTDNRPLGRKGEDAACIFLIGRGHSILERNWRLGRLEIDIISLNENGIHFVEVKCRRLPMEAEPQESVTRTKQQRICKAALGYINSRNCFRTGDLECHFDIISVILGKDSFSIRYFEDAFFPGI